MAGINCGACKQPILDDNNQPRTSCSHTCKACKAWLHSGVLCAAVWEPCEWSAVQLIYISHFLYPYPYPTPKNNLFPGYPSHIPG